MLKLSLWRGIAALLLPLLVSACGGGGSSAPPPTGGIQVTSGNGQAFVTWTADPGVDYWVVYAPTASVSNGQALTGSSVHLWANGTAVTSPLQITGLTNGTSYSFAINGRVSGGVGGAFSAIQSIVPRPAGANWIPGSYSPSATAGDLHGLAFGTSSADSLNYYLAVGDNGSMYKGLDGVAQSLNGYSWSAIPAPVTTPSVNYKAAVNMYGRYIAVGDGGIGGGANSIVSGTDLATWTAALWATGSSVPSGALNALASNGTALVAVGNGGIAYYTVDGLTWTASSLLPTTANLYGVAYSSATGLWIAVGAGGTLLTSPDAITWTAGNSGVGSTVTLRSVAATTGNVVVAVGDNGTVITNSTMTTAAGGAGSWIKPTVGPTNTNALYAVSTDSAVNGLDPQFLAVGQNGATYTSLDGLTWTPPAVGSTLPTSTLYSILGTASKYLVVGTAGANFSSIN